MSEKEFKKAKEIAIRQIYIGEKTENQIREKLFTKNIEEKIIDRVLDDLKTIKYIDDIDYVRKYIDYGFSKGRGLFRIREELKNKGVSQFDIEDGVYEYETERNLDIREIEYKVAKKIAKIELGYKEFLPKKDRDKLARKLSYRGFSYELVHSILNTIPIGDEDERK